MRWLAPAKINLHLRVGKRRADGFHPLCSWMVTIGLFDRLVLKANPAAGQRGVLDPAGGASPGPDHPSTGERGGAALPAGPDARPSQAPNSGGASGVGVVAAELPLRCDDPTIPTDERNLVIKAARAFATAAGNRPLPWKVTLLKSIPHGGGLGGGSSDAATMLVALNQLSATNWAVDRLATVGATVGSDVPFFFFAPSAVIRGRGEAVRKTAAPATKWATLVLPAFAVSTAACYRRFDEMGLGSDALSDDAVENEPDFGQWATLKAADLAARLVNDLEAPAFAIEPELGKLRSQIERDTKHIVRMSGSGSSLFALADEPAEAMEVASVIQHNCGVRAMAVEIAPTAPVPSDE